jgi:molecular chaperone DnaJ
MNCYKILEVDRSASPEVIKKAYKTLCLKYHPDRYDEKKQAWATWKLQQLNQAYEILSNPRERQKYDREHFNPWIVWLNNGLIGLFKLWANE